MKRFLIHVSTHWCGGEDTFRAVAESESDLWDFWKRKSCSGKRKEID